MSQETGAKVENTDHQGTRDFIIRDHIVILMAIPCSSVGRVCLQDMEAENNADQPFRNVRSEAMREVTGTRGGREFPQL